MEEPTALKWLTLSEDDEGDPLMEVDSAALDHLVFPEKVNPDSPLNLLSIFGAARQGKSFLMNLLAQRQDLFKISNSREPCTQGVDISSHLMTLHDFEVQQQPSSGEAQQPPSSEEAEIAIGFVDAEGQGDRDISYDSRLICPVLLASRVVIFNWKDSMQTDRILNQLSVLAEAAKSVDSTGHASPKGDSPVFGHLHIVFRDWNFTDSDGEAVKHDLFELECSDDAKKSQRRSREAVLRDHARVGILSAFNSVKVWLLPPPVACTTGLRERIRFEQLSHKFTAAAAKLRCSIAAHLSTPLQSPLLADAPLTLARLRCALPKLVNWLNKGQQVVPRPLFESMVREEAQQAYCSCLTSFEKFCENVTEKQRERVQLQLSLFDEHYSGKDQCTETQRNTRREFHGEESEGPAAFFATAYLDCILRSHQHSCCEKFAFATRTIPSELLKFQPIPSNNCALGPTGALEISIPMDVNARQTLFCQISRLIDFQLRSNEHCYEQLCERASFAAVESYSREIRSIEKQRSSSSMSLLSSSLCDIHNLALQKALQSFYISTTAQFPSGQTVVNTELEKAAWLVQDTRRKWFQDTAAERLKEVEERARSQLEAINAREQRIEEDYAKQVKALNLQLQNQQQLLMDKKQHRRCSLSPDVTRAQSAQQQFKQYWSSYVDQSITTLSLQGSGGKGERQSYLVQSVSHLLSAHNEDKTAGLGGLVEQLLAVENDLVAGTVEAHPAQTPAVISGYTIGSNSDHGITSPLGSRDPVPVNESPEPSTNDKDTCPGYVPTTQLGQVKTDLNRVNIDNWMEQGESIEGLDQVLKESNVFSTHCSVLQQEFPDWRSQLSFIAGQGTIELEGALHRMRDQCSNRPTEAIQFLIRYTQDCVARKEVVAQHMSDVHSPLRDPPFAVTGRDVERAPTEEKTEYHLCVKLVPVSDSSDEGNQGDLTTFLLNPAKPNETEPKNNPPGRLRLEVAHNTTVMNSSIGKKTYGHDVVARQERQDLSKWRVVDLRALLKGRGLSVKGRKSELIARLHESSQASFGSGKSDVVPRCAPQNDGDTSFRAAAFPCIELPLPVPTPATLDELNEATNLQDAPGGSPALVLGRLSTTTGLGAAAVRISRRHVRAKVIIESLIAQDNEISGHFENNDLVRSALKVEMLQLSSNASRYRKAKKMTDLRPLDWDTWSQLRKGNTVSLRHGDEIQLHSTVPLKYRLAVEILHKEENIPMLNDGQENSSEVANGTHADNSTAPPTLKKRGRHVQEPAAAAHKLSRN